MHTTRTFCNTRSPSHINKQLSLLDLPGAAVSAASNNLLKELHEESEERRAS
jgi:hypothetical protein